MKWSPLTRIKEWFERLHDIKTEHQYLGRYSIEKLCAFHEYQQKTSVYRVIAVIVFTPMPTVLTLWGLDCLPLRDPRGGAKHHATTFLRSMFSHTIMTYMFLMAGKQALGLNAKNSNYTHKTAAKIAVCVAFTLEIYCVIWAFAWRFPTPFREFTGVTPWGILTVIFNYLFAKKDLSRVVGRLKRYIPVVGTQLVLFYFLLFLSVGFAAVPLYGQIAMILLFPVIKLAIKRALWKYARNLDDISADVTICMVEISGSLYQTVCMQYVQNNILALVIMVMDFLQAAFEARTYMNQNYMGDSKNTLQTAVKIVESALFSGTVDKSMDSSIYQERGGESASARSLHSTSAAPSNTVKSGSVGPSKIRPVSNKAKPVQQDMSFEVDETFKDVLARLLRKGRSWTRKRRRRRERKYSTSGENEEQAVKEKRKRKGREDIKRRGSGSARKGEVTPRRQVTRRKSAESTKGIAQSGVNISRETATSVYINARVIRKERARRLLDFGQVTADQHHLANANLQHELPTASPTTYTPSTQQDIATGLTHRGSIGETSRVFAQMRADQQDLANGEGQSELPMAPPTAFTPLTQREAATGLSHRGSITLTHRGSIGETNRLTHRGSIGETYRVSAVDSNDPTESQSQRGSISQPHRGSITDMQFVDVGEGLTARSIIRRKSSTNSQLLRENRVDRSCQGSVVYLDDRAKRVAQLSPTR